MLPEVGGCWLTENFAKGRNELTHGKMLPKAGTIRESSEQHFWFDIRIIKIKIRLPICPFYKWVGAIFYKRQQLEYSSQFFYAQLRSFSTLTPGSIPWMNEFSLESLEIRCLTLVPIPLDDSQNRLI